MLSRMQTETVDLTRLRRKGDGIVYQFKRAEDSRKVPYHSAKDQFIDRDGLPFIGQVSLITLISVTVKWLRTFISWVSGCE